MKVSRLVLTLLFVHICLSVSNCSGNGPQMPFLPRWDSEEPETPRTSASLQLTQQAQVLLENGRVDDAISLLERAVGLDPSSGLNYYFLSEAWRMKGNLTQAEEFHRLAELYPEDDPDWDSRMAEQQRKLKSLREWPRE